MVFVKKSNLSCVFFLGGGGGGGDTNHAREGSLLIFWIEKNAF